MSKVGSEASAENLKTEDKRSENEKNPEGY